MQITKHHFFQSPLAVKIFKVFMIIFAFWLMPVIGSHFGGFGSARPWFGVDFVTYWIIVIQSFMDYLLFFIVFYALGILSIVLWWKKPSLMKALFMFGSIIFLCGQFMLHILLILHWFR